MTIDAHFEMCKHYNYTESVLLSETFSCVFSVAKATLQSQMSVRLSICLSVCLSQKPLSLSELCLLTIKPINHRAY